MSVLTLGQIKDYEIHSDISKYMVNNMKFDNYIIRNYLLSSNLK